MKIKETEQAVEHVEEDLLSEEESSNDVSWNIPEITMRQTEHNCWEVILTEEERELINEFLEI